MYLFRLTYIPILVFISPKYNLRKYCYVSSYVSALRVVLQSYEVLQ